MAEVSIIVPIYNVSGYLNECIDSIVSQTLREIEIILVDDGSTDGSGDICDRYAQKDDRIVVIHKKNEGLVRARKTGLKVASGRYIGYVDGDDWIDSDMYERLYGLINESGAEVAICSRIDESEFGSKKVLQNCDEGIYDRNDLKKKIFPRMIVGEGFFEWGMSPCVWDKLYKKEVIERHQFSVDDSIMMGEDAACTFPLLLDSKRVAVTHDCLYHYRQSDASMVKTSADTDKNKERGRFLTLYKDTCALLKGKTEIYDMTDQWLKYLLFLMVPRADVLYDGYDELERLFPFSSVKRGERVVVYCAGLYGQRLYRYLKNTGFCHAVALADKEALNLKKKGMDVILPEEISDREFDAIVVASSYERTRKAIIRDLKGMYPDRRIYGMDLDWVFEDSTLRAFGLMV